MIGFHILANFDEFIDGIIYCVEKIHEFSKSLEQVDKATQIHNKLEQLNFRFERKK